MPINNQHKYIVSLTLDPYFSRSTHTQEELQQLILNIRNTIQTREKNHFYKIGHLFHCPWSFFGLDIFGSVHKGEIRKQIIEDIDFRINKMATALGTTALSCGWNKTDLLELESSFDDEGDNLYCQTDDPPINTPDISEYALGANQHIAKSMYAAVDTILKDKHNISKEFGGVTLDDVKKISQSLAIVDSTYIHEFVDSIPDDYVHIFRKENLDQLINNLPPMYSDLKTYFGELKREFTEKKHRSFIDIDDVFELFGGDKLAQIALASVIAIAIKHDIPDLKAAVFGMIKDTQCQDKVKSAFIENVAMPITEFIELQDVLSKRAALECISSDKINPYMINSLLKIIKKGKPIAHGAEKFLFERLNIAELSALCNQIREQILSPQAHAQAIKTELLISTRIAKLTDDVAMSKDIGHDGADAKKNSI
ncbi:MAG: hypothetical protein Q8R24_04935 [Legionellaceae bacterium]|nr:hypothetical protein [Legionellaceae bacterium]